VSILVSGPLNYCRCDLIHSNHCYGFSHTLFKSNLDVQQSGPDLSQSKEVITSKSDLSGTKRFPIIQIALRENFGHRKFTHALCRLDNIIAVYSFFVALKWFSLMHNS